MAPKVNAETNTDTKVFISYAGEDEPIAEEMERQLRALYRNRIKFFLDRKSIAPGDEWEKIIKENLSDSDILIVIYRGIHSEYVGFEVGTFLNTRPGASPTDNLESQNLNKRRPAFRASDEVKSISSGSILVFHNSEAVPTLFQHIQLIRVPDNESLPYDGPNHELTWSKTRLGQALFSLSSYNNLYPAPQAHEHDKVESFNKEHGTVAREITRAFREAGADDIVYKHPVQDEMEITLSAVADIASAAPESAHWGVIADEAKVSAPTRTWALFKLNPAPGKAITWGWLRARLLEKENGRRRIPWMDKVERDVGTVLRDQVIDGDGVTFISNQQVYRPIVSRQEVLRSGVRRIYVQFVETLPRHFPGTPKTSRILASIMMASRYHFTYIEDWDHYSGRFSQLVDDAEFSIACRELISDLDRIEHEGLELGLGDAPALARAFGDENGPAIQETFKTYFSSRNSLSDTLEGFLVGSACTGRGEVVGAINEFFRRTCRNNFRFLEMALRLYVKEIEDASRKRETFRVREGEGEDLSCKPKHV